MVAHSVSARGIKKAYNPNLSPSSSEQALMVQISWTKAPVVSMTVTKDFYMTTSTMWVRKNQGYKVVSQQQMHVLSGMKFYFVQSSEEGWYYVLRLNESTNTLSCSCPGGRKYGHCKHREAVAAYEEFRPVVVETEVEVVATIIPLGDFVRLIENYQDVTVVEGFLESCKTS